MRLKKKDYDIMSVLVSPLIMEFPFLAQTTLADSAKCFDDDTLMLDDNYNSYKTALYYILRIVNSKCKDLSKYTFNQIASIINDYEYKQLLKKKKDEKARP
jgi:hypothetical protein